MDVSPPIVAMDKPSNKESCFSLDNVHLNLLLLILSVKSPLRVYPHYCLIADAFILFCSLFPLRLCSRKKQQLN